VKRAKKTVTTVVPTPVKIDSRICFGIAYFTSEADALTYDAHVRAKGRAYNGGFFHGMPCGRDKGWDYMDATLGQLFAVTN
jgi:hypothetical protein